MRNKRLQADRGKSGMRRRKLLPDGAITTLVKPVEYRFYRFIKTGMMMVIACFKGGMLMMAAVLMARVMTSSVMRVVLLTRLVLGNQRPN